MRPDDLVRYVVSRRGKASRVAIHKIVYLSDSEFVWRRIAANVILRLINSSARVRNETGLKYYVAKLGPFSTALDNAIKRLINSGEIDEVFDDGRFLYVPKNIKDHKVEPHFARVMEEYVHVPDKKLINKALKRVKFDPTVVKL